MTINELYHKWLCDKVEIEFGGQTTKTYHGLLQQLHEKQFVWVIPNDNNRVGDALDLRVRFRNEHGLPDNALPSRLDEGASVLEVLVGLSIRLAFWAEGTEPRWAWQLIENLELHKMYDPVNKRKANQINEKLDTMIWRTYGRDGSGGFFPLAWPDPSKDYSKIELWYQMAAYVLEIPEM